MLVCGVYIMCLKQFKLWELPTVVGSIVVVGELTCCALLQYVYDFKTTLMNKQHSGT